MNTLQYILDRNLKGYLGDYATTADELEGVELSDLSHDRADSDERVIYYGKAHALIASVGADTEEEATQTAHECGGFDGKSYNEIATIIAYWIVYQEHYDTLREEIDELIKVLEDYVSRTQHDLDNNDYTEESIEKFEEQIQRAEDLISTLEDK